MKTKVLVMLITLVLVSSTAFSQQDKVREDVKIIKDDQLRVPPHELNDNLPPPIPDLTKQQEEQMKQIHLDAQKFSLPLKNEIKVKEAQLNALRTAENPDMAAINKLVEEIGAISVKLAKEHEANHQKIRKLLTESQRIFFDSQERMPRIEKRIIIEKD